MRLLIDHHYPLAIAHHLRQSGRDVWAAQERGWQSLEDDELLARCWEESRALLTNNAVDFTLIARDLAGDGRSHAGLIFTSDASRPRTRDAIGRFVADLDDLMRREPDERSMRDRVIWL